jgi:hypothetical protein
MKTLSTGVDLVLTDKQTDMATIICGFLQFFSVNVSETYT